MRPHRRPGPLEHVLVAGELVDVDRIAATLALLPGTAYGQVYVECPAGADLPPLAAPPRVAVTRLVRAPGAAPRSALATAVEAWRAEWVPDLPDPDREVSMWSAELGSWV